ncbi:MAG: lasso peptide biosynthesis B2 protein, partial [Actinomycetota bacterium]|nr:lasso peptide biosynthesis B2 protein [Actinomycetota bacterium]
MRRYLDLSPQQQRDVRCALVLIPVVVVGLRIVGYAQVVTALDRTSRRHRPSTSTAPVNDARAVAAMVSIASRLGVVPSKCLDRSLVTWWMLRRRGIPAVVRLGASSDPAQRMMFHAWVECKGEVVNDALDVLAR